MCTIGVVFDRDAICTFKQCDLIPKTVFNEPEVREGTNGISYIAMTRKGRAGIWAGVNSVGVAFAAADAYTTSSNYYTKGDKVQELFAAYENTVKSCTTATEAAKSLCDFYKGNKTTKCNNPEPFPSPDIALVTGWADSKHTHRIAILIEYMPNPFNRTSVRTIERSEGHFVTTNHFRLQPESITYPANHSTYLRLNRAEAILQNDPTVQGIKTLLTDQYYGKTELSICRETDYLEKEFQTQATALFTVDKSSHVCEYQINGNPKSNPLKVFSRSL